MPNAGRDQDATDDGGKKQEVSAETRATTTYLVNPPQALHDQVVTWGLTCPPSAKTS